MREIDRQTIEERGIPGLRLLELAGRAVAHEVIERFEPDSVILLCGRGNNGGDGFIAARYLHQNRIACKIILLAKPDQLKGDALAAWQAVPEGVSSESRDACEGLVEELRKYDVVIDALLGTGARGPAEGVFGEAIEAMNASKVPVVSVDIPSGLPADGQSPEGPVVRAALTVTMGPPKIGMMIHPGVQMTGTVVTEELEFPRDLLEDPQLKINVLGPADIARKLPPRPPDGNKGTFGKVLVLAGSQGMSGAAVMTAQSAGRSGAGLVYAGAVDALMPVFDLHLIEAVKVPIRSATGRHFDADSIEDALRHAEACDAVALGPGLGKGEGVREFVEAICLRCNKPMVIDADALNALAHDTSILRKRPSATILTPHPGEMARLTATTTEAVQSERMKSASDFAASHQVVVLLKGAQTLVATPGGDLYINTSGNTGLAKGGSGDVLTGLLAGLLAQGMDAADAAVSGAFIHGLAADLAAARMSVRAMTPTDLMSFFGEAFRTIEGSV